MVAPARKRVAAAAAIAAPDLEVSFMTFLQKDVGNDAPTVEAKRICRRTDLHPAIATLEIDFGYTANQNLFHQLQVRCKISSDLKANSITISGCPSNREGLLEVGMRGKSPVRTTTTVGLCHALQLISAIGYLIQS